MAAKKTKRKAGKKRSNRAGQAKALKRVATRKISKKKAKRPGKSPAPKALKRVEAPKKSGKKIRARKMPHRKIRGRADRAEFPRHESTRGGPDTGGQSGDTQGLSGLAETDSESVKELLEEGQAYEAEVVEGVESVPDADQGPVRTHEVPEEDVPEEYIGGDAQK
jgi:hypothetical protein